MSNFLPESFLQRCLLGLLAGLLLTNWGSASYMLAKAKLSELLLGTTWEQAVEQGEELRPWPSMDALVAGRISIAGRELVTLDRASGQALAFGPGLMAGDITKLSESEYVLAAHRDTHFSGLDKLQKGSLLRWETVAGLTADYEVIETKIVDSSIETFEYLNRADTLVLITCYPFGASFESTDLRYVIEAKIAGEPRAMARIATEDSWLVALNQQPRNRTIEM